MYETTTSNNYDNYTCSNTRIGTTATLSVRGPTPYVHVHAHNDYYIRTRKYVQWNLR